MSDSAGCIIVRIGSLDPHKPIRRPDPRAMEMEAGDFPFSTGLFYGGVLSFCRCPPLILVYGLAPPAVFGLRGQRRERRVSHHSLKIDAIACHLPSQLSCGIICL